MREQAVIQEGKTMIKDDIAEMYQQYLEDMIEGEPAITLAEYTEIVME